MASLALAAAVVVLSLWFVAVASLVLSYLGFRLMGAIFGTMSAVAGIWLLCILPHAPLLGAMNLAAGFVAIWRYFKREER
jgi:hypothetical protein